MQKTANGRSCEGARCSPAMYGCQSTRNTDLQKRAECRMLEDKGGTVRKARIAVVVRRDTAALSLPGRSGGAVRCYSAVLAIFPSHSVPYTQYGINNSPRGRVGHRSRLMLAFPLTKSNALSGDIVSQCGRWATITLGIATTLLSQSRATRSHALPSTMRAGLASVDAIADQTLCGAPISTLMAIRRHECRRSRSPVNKPRRHCVKGIAQRRGFPAYCAVAYRENCRSV